MQSSITTVQLLKLSVEEYTKKGVIKDNDVKILYALTVDLANELKGTGYYARLKHSLAKIFAQITNNQSTLKKIKGIDNLFTMINDGYKKTIDKYLGILDNFRINMAPVNPNPTSDIGKFLELIPKLQNLHNKGTPKLIFHGGSTENGCFHGYGEAIYEDESRYEGNWDYNTRRGKGVLIYKNGNRYEGNWDNNRFHGQGEFKWKNGDKYKGDWVYGERHGHGTFTNANGDKYEGQWVNGQRYGEGVIQWKNGSQYKGEWVNNQLHGKGTLTVGDDIYEGEWVKNYLLPQKGIPDEFICPITCTIINSPVALVGDKGVKKYYERLNLIEWLKSNSTNPFTGKHVDRADVEKLPDSQEYFDQLTEWLADNGAQKFEVSVGIEGMKGETGVRKVEQNNLVANGQQQSEASGDVEGGAKEAAIHQE